MRFVNLLPLIAFVCLAGCESNHYQVTLAPEGDSLQRELVCWRQSGESQTAVKGFSEHELRMLADAYQMQEPVKKDANRFQFSGKFSGEFPADVGGAGRYLHYRTSLGTAAIYIERFRGQIDLAALVDQRRAAANQATDLLLEWFAAEMRNDSAAEKLRVLDEELRRDLNNLVVYGLIAASHPNPPSDPQAQIKDFAARYGEYLIERGYISQESLPRLLAAAQGSDSEQLAMARELLTRKMKLEPGEAQRALKFLATAEAAEKSFTEFVQTSRTYQVLVEQMRAKYGEKIDGQPTPGDVMYYLTSEAGFAILRADDTLDVTLRTATRPVATNGNWDEATLSVTWKASFASRAAQVSGCVPTVNYAVWSTADAKAQQKLFGRVALDGRQLALYALWHASLDTQDATAWDEFLAKESSDGKLLDKVAEFHFPSERQAAATAPASKPKLTEHVQQLFAEALAEHNSPEH